MTEMAEQVSIFSVDDDPNDVLLLRTALKAVRFPGAINFATDGQEAIELLDSPASPLIPDLLLLDLKMPRRDGFECLQWLRSQEKFRALPVVIFTTSAHSDDIRKAYELGADLFLVKPLAYGSLLALARALLKALEEKTIAFTGLQAMPEFRPRP